MQGVGFRPFVYRLATGLGLSGWVRNSPAGVVIEAEGDVEAIGQFAARLRDEAPSLARVDEIDAMDVDATEGGSGFSITQSGLTGAVGAITVDAALCDDCRRELLSGDDRRSGHALITCTNCGPRYSILRKAPYDRPNTTMAGFEMCPACQCEYADPADRRFHAQPIACHQCGPRLSLLDSLDHAIDGDALAGTADLLRSGKVVAIKGLGGFHLAADARSHSAVKSLRDRKHRDDKPLAVMCATVDAARSLVELSESAIELMRSPACPIVLAAKREGADLAPDIAPQSHRLGVMLPYTPIQHLLFAAGAPSVLVMTSGNVSDEPITIDNADAVARLGSLCDAFLLHDRPIERAVDDSIFIAEGEARPVPVRRARGYVPAPIALPSRHFTQGLAVGGELKNTVAVVRGGEAILSQHMGDLSEVRAYENFEKTTADLLQLFGVRPDWIAHDLHPGYQSTRFARRLAARLGAALVGVQHHHAHAAAVLAEHRFTGRALALVCDGTGYGDDGSIWGGELLLADLTKYTRVATLKPLRLAGGDSAARDGRRSAMALLYQAVGDAAADHPASRMLFADDDDRSLLGHLIARNIGCVFSSGAGRVFDGVAALLGICAFNHFEGRAAMALESAAYRHGPELGVAPLYEISSDEIPQISFAPLIREILQGNGSAGKWAAIFHEQFAQAWADVIRRSAETSGVTAVALSGGVFCNAIISGRLREMLEKHGLSVLSHQVVPCGDGGLSLGQAAVASALAEKGGV